jgi:hypothetical protein
MPAFVESFKRKRHKSLVSDLGRDSGSPKLTFSRHNTSLASNIGPGSNHINPNSSKIVRDGNISASQGQLNLPSHDSLFDLMPNESGSTRNISPALAGGQKGLCTNKPDGGFVYCFKKFITGQSVNPDRYGFSTTNAQLMSNKPTTPKLSAHSSFIRQRNPPVRSHSQHVNGISGNQTRYLSSAIIKKC